MLAGLHWTALTAGREGAIGLAGRIASNNWDVHIDRHHGFEISPENVLTVVGECLAADSFEMKRDVPPVLRGLRRTWDEMGASVTAGLFQEHAHLIDAALGRRPKPEGPVDEEALRRLMLQRVEVVFPDLTPQERLTLYSGGVEVLADLLAHGELGLRFSPHHHWACDCRSLIKDMDALIVRLRRGLEAASRDWGVQVYLGMDVPVRYWSHGYGLKHFRVG